MKENKMSFIKGFLGFSVSAWINAGLSFFATPIITRAFLPDELGKINLFVSLVNMFLYFSYLGIDQAFTRFYHEPLGNNDKKSMLTVCLTLSSVIFVFVAMGILICYKAVSSSIIGYVGFVVPVSVIVSIISQMIIRYFNLAARMEKNIILFNVQAIASTVISNISYVAVALVSATAENAIIFRTGLNFILAVILFVLAIKTSLSLKADFNKNVVKDILVYALPVCPAALLATVNNSLGQLLLKNFVDYSAIGIYSNAVTIAAILTIIQSGFNSYWGPFVYENYKTQQKRIIKVHHIMSFAIIIFALLIIFCQDLIYIILVGEKFWASKQLFPLLIISPVCYTIAETLGMGIRLEKKTYLNIPVAAINVFVNIFLCFILLPKIGVIGAAVASAISSICMLIVRSYWGEKRYRCSDNYFKLIVALATLVITAVIHVFVYDLWVKYIVYFFAVIIVCIAYIPQIKMIIMLVKEIIKK